MPADYPVIFDVTPPEKFERTQMFIRILALIILSVVGNIFGLLYGLAYLVFPVLAAIFVSQKGAQRFLEEDAPRLTTWLRWLMALLAYLAIVTDRFPTEKPEQFVRFEVQPGGSPTVGSALLRLIYSIPSALVLALVGIVSAILWLVAAVLVLIQESYPAGIYNFQRGFLRWEARLLGYHASLVERYPPFALDTGPEADAAAA
ncbi:MAG: DUF4389 domain-containing protein [Chloroflexi bacterium]|nr:DUF4389 domain-containing protein [Chloroflexota bacterium]